MTPTQAKKLKEGDLIQYIDDCTISGKWCVFLRTGDTQRERKDCAITFKPAGKEKPAWQGIGWDRINLFKDFAIRNGKKIEL